MDIIAEVPASLLRVPSMLAASRLTQKEKNLLIPCCIVDGLLLLGCLATIIYLCMWRRKRRAEHAGESRDSLPLTAPPANPDDTWHQGTGVSEKQLTFVKDHCAVEIVETDAQEEPCPICLEPLMQKDDTKILQLHCKHMYHEMCIVHWIVESHGIASCPMCMSSIPVYHHRVMTTTSQVPSEVSEPE